LRRESFDLVVLGPTLTKNDRHHLPYMVKKCQSGTRVLVMHTDGERHPCVDANLDTGSRFEALLEKIAALQGSQAVLAKCLGQPTAIPGGGRADLFTNA